MKRMIIFTVILSLAIFMVNGCKTAPSLKDNPAEINDKTLVNKQGTFKLSISADNDSKSTASLMVSALKKKEELIGLVVTVESLMVHRTSDGNAGWISIPITDGTFDLIALDKTSLADIIAETQLAAGNYNQIRFVVTSAEVTTASGTYDATVPSGKIKIGVPFKVNDDGTTEILIEVNPKASLRIAGNKNNPKYILKPVLHIKKVDDSD